LRYSPTLGSSYRRSHFKPYRNNLHRQPRAYHWFYVEEGFNLLARFTLDEDAPIPCRKCGKLGNLSVSLDCRWFGVFLLFINHVGGKRCYLVQVNIWSYSSVLNLQDPSQITDYCLRIVNRRKELWSLRRKQPIRALTKRRTLHYQMRYDGSHHQVLAC
jgi:hypothetical protein